jgi:hypothetical protein
VAWYDSLLKRVAGAADAAPTPGAPAARSARRVPPATASNIDAFLDTARDVLRDEQGRPILDPVTGRPVLDGEGPQPQAPAYAEENFDLNEAGVPVPADRPDPLLAVLEAIGIAQRNMGAGGPGPVVRNDALASLIAERQAMRAAEAAPAGPQKNTVAADSLGRQPSSDLSRPARPSVRPARQFGLGWQAGGDPSPAPDLPSNTLSEEPYEKLVPVAVEGSLQREFVPARDEFGNAKLDSSGQPIPAVTVDRWDPELGAYVTTAPDPLRPITESPLLQQTITNEKHLRIDPTTGRALTEQAYENVAGQIVTRGPTSFFAGRQVVQPDGSTRLEVDQSKPIIVLERGRNSSDGNRSAESRVFLAPRNDGGYQVMVTGADGQPQSLRATDFDVQRLLAQGYQTVHGELPVGAPDVPESPEALARTIIETRAGTADDGRTFRVGVASPEAKTDIVSRVDQLRKFGSVDDLRRFFEELGSARVGLDDVGAGADNALVRGQMAYKAFVDSGVSAPPAPRQRPEMDPTAIREGRIRRLVTPTEQTIGVPGSAAEDVVSSSSTSAAPGFQVTTGPAASDIASAVDPTSVTPGAGVPFTAPGPIDIPATTSLDVLSGLRRFNPDLLDAVVSPETASSGMMDFTITPDGQQLLASNAIDELLGQLRGAGTQSTDVSAGAMPELASGNFARLPDTFMNQFATASSDVSGGPIPMQPIDRRPWTRSRGIWDQPLADRVRAARDRRTAGLSMPTQSAFDDMLRSMQPDLQSAPPEENVRAAVEQILRGNANRRVSEQGQMVDSADPTVLGPEASVQSSAADRFSTMVDADEADATEKVLRGAESVMPQEAGISRSDLRALAMEGMMADPSLSQFVDGARPPLAFKDVEMRSSSARPGAASLDKIAERQAQIDALRESVDTDYPEPAAIRSRLAEISEALASGEASGSRREFAKVGTDKTGRERSERAELRAERARLKERLADSESPSYMQARESALAEISKLEESAAAADDKFGMSNAGSVGDAQQAILNKLLLPSQSFNEEEFLQAAEQMFGVTTRAGEIDSGRVFAAIRAAAERRGMAPPSDSDIVFAALSDLQRPVRELSGKVHTIGPRGLQSVADYISRGLDARRSGQPTGPDATLLRPGQADRPKSAWEAINEQFERVAGPMLDQPAPPPELPAVYDQFIPPFLRLPSTLDDLDLAFRGMTIEETEAALEQLSAAENAAMSVTLPPTQDPARLAEIIAAARDAGRRRLGNVPPESRRPDTFTDAETKSLDLDSLERDVNEWRQSIEYLEANPDKYPPTELAAARTELKDAEQRLEAARSQASATAQPVEPPAQPGSSEYRSRLFSLAQQRAALVRTQASIEEELARAAGKSGVADPVDPSMRTPSAGGGFVGGVEGPGRAAGPKEDLREVLARASADIEVIDQQIDALTSGQASAALETPRKAAEPAPSTGLRGELYSTPSPVVVRNADELRDSVNYGSAGIAYSFVVPKDTAVTLRSRVNPDLARMKITRETGPDEVALSGLIGGGDIEGGIRFMNATDLNRVPADGSVEILHLDPEGRPTFYDPSGMDLRNPTARDLEEMKKSEEAAARQDSRQARQMTEAAEDENLAITSGESPTARQFEDANAARTSDVRAGRLARASQRSREREALLAAQAEEKGRRVNSRLTGESLTEEQLADIAARGRKSAGFDDTPPAAREEEGRPVFDESQVGDSGMEGTRFVDDATQGPQGGPPRSRGLKRGAAGAAGLVLAGVGGKAGLDYLSGSEAQAAPILASTLVAEPSQEDRNYSADDMLDRVRRARQYQSYLVSGHMMPR